MTIKVLQNHIKGFTLIELMVVIAIISILVSIGVPNYISYRNKGFCTMAERDAEIVEMAIADYFGLGSHNDLPDFNDLDVVTNNPVSISGDPNQIITIVVTEESGRCPDQYQIAHNKWDAVLDTFTLKVQ